jgi:hypothetical protein
MWRRRPLENLVPLLLAALMPWCGCAPQAAHRATSEVVSEEWVAYSDADDLPRTAAGEPSPAALRVRQLEQEMAERDRQIAAVQTDLQAAGEQPAAATTATRGAESAAPRPAEPVPAAQASAPPVAAPAAKAPATDARPGGQGAAEAKQDTPQDAAAAPPRSADAAPPPAAATRAAAPVADVPVVSRNDPRLQEAERRIARLQRQLASEVKRRQEVEAEMTRLLQETSAGPFDQAVNVVEKHLREELTRAHKEIRDLRATLTSERRARDDLERRYAALQAQVQATAKAAPAAGVSNEEMEALKERQRRVLASIQQDLAASKQREAEMRQALEQAQDPNGVSVADEVSGLRSENSALQMRLDEEHQRNRELSAKLQLATRVTDLIYKMQSTGTEGVAAVPLPEPH